MGKWSWAPGQAGRARGSKLPKIIGPIDGFGFRASSRTVCLALRNVNMCGSFHQPSKAIHKNTYPNRCSNETNRSEGCTFMHCLQIRSRGDWNTAHVIFLYALSRNTSPFCLGSLFPQNCRSDWMLNVFERMGNQGPRLECLFQLFGSQLKRGLSDQLYTPFGSCWCGLEKEPIRLQGPLKWSVERLVALIGESGYCRGLDWVRRLSGGHAPWEAKAGTRASCS